MVQASDLGVESRSCLGLFLRRSELHGLIVPDTVKPKSLNELSENLVIGVVDCSFEGPHLLLMLLQALLGLSMTRTFSKLYEASTRSSTDLVVF